MRPFQLSIIYGQCNDSDEKNQLDEGQNLLIFLEMDDMQLSMTPEIKRRSGGNCKAKVS